jgi:signal transduction histidine kinase
LPEFLASIAHHFAAEQQAVLIELHSLSAHIDHINEIVAMQQSYARIACVTEELAIESLVEDAIRLNAAALDRHGICVIRQYNEAPPVEIDKHKVLQILINLIRNAKYAMDDATARGKRLTLRIDSPGSEAVVISILDEGAGIPAANLTRIFEHGFTTRENGHGFGLHSAALAAKEMGGTLRVESAGAGSGAVFILSLPVHPNRSHL